MIKRFEQLDEEKKERIINAALKEFAENGYDKGSTNVIVKEAGISKGLIFHYFENKINLYMYLFDYCTQLITKELYETVDFENGDILTRIQDSSIKKVLIFKKYPHIFEFAKNSYHEPNIQVNAMIMKKQKEGSKEAQRLLIEKVDYSCFREGLDMEKTMVTIYSTLEKISISAIEKTNIDVDKIIKQLDDYIHYFKKLFYK